MGADSIALDYLAADLELQYLVPCTLPASLSAQLEESISDFSIDSSSSPIDIFPWLGWAVAACLLVFFNLESPPTDDSSPSPMAKVTKTASEKRSLLLEQAPDTPRLAFSPAPDSDVYKEIKGDLVWNDERQEGYMSFASLPVNDPTKNQYQLWIVDPKRDELPVDGGVFDVTAGSGPVIIPIRNALPVSQPTMFVITLEQPGGVVKSKQEVVVAIAKS
tara:strand:- start:198 stop:854 length:657 start_codon:yes stop_codon:yes gene_type:complete